MTDFDAPLAVLESGSREEVNTFLALPQGLMVVAGRA